MFSLIITIFAIALVVALIIVTAYYGGPIFMGNAAKVAAETLVNQSIQIAAARQVAIAQGRAIPDGAAVTLPTDLLRVMPTPPASAYVSGEPAIGDWEYYVPGVSSHFGISTKISKKACMEVNKQHDFIGIPAAWDGKSAIQCFGPSPTGYTYLFQPSGVTPTQRDAVLQHSIDAAKPEMPSASAGYPRLCPNGETISEGVCDGASTTPKPTGFWIITASAEGYYDTSLLSEGYSTSCPAGAVDPTGGGVQPAPSKPGEPFNIDGLVELGWSLPPDYDSSFQMPLTRTWCIPANEADVLDNISNRAQSGGVEGVSQVVIPSTNDTDPEMWPSSTNETALISAGGKQWAVLASAFSTDTDNRTTGDSLSMVGHKVAIGKAATATQSYFVNSPAVVFNGVQYQNTAGTITFPAPQPPCQPLVKNAPLGTGGRIVDIIGTTDVSMMLKEDGSVWTTGSGSDGLLGNCSYSTRLTWTRVATGATKIMAKSRAAFFLKGDGTIWGTGELSDFLGDAAWRTSKFTQLPLTNVVDLFGGSAYVLMKRSDGTLWQLGKELFDWRDIDFSSPVQVADNVLTAVPYSFGFYVIKTDNSLWDVPFGGTSTKIADNVASVSATNNARIYIKTDGSVYAQGNDITGCKVFGQGASGPYQYATDTRIVQSLGPISSAKLTHNYTMLLGTNGVLWAAGCNDPDASRFGDNTQNDRPSFSSMASNVKMFSGPFIVDYSSNLFATGMNYTGQFGNGTRKDEGFFVPIQY